MGSDRRRLTGDADLAGVLFFHDPVHADEPRRYRHRLHDTSDLKKSIAVLPFENFSEEKMLWVGTTTF